MAEGSRILALFLEIRLALLTCQAKVLVIAANSDSLLDNRLQNACIRCLGRGIGSGSRG